MRRSFALITLVALIASCRREEPAAPQDFTQEGLLVESSPALPEPAGDPYTQEELDRIVIRTLESRNDFRWEWMDLRTLWSAVQYNDHTLAIGYQPAGAVGVDDRLHEVDIRSGAWKAVHDALLARILDALNADRKSEPVTLDDILVEDDPVLPILTLRLTDKRAITMLANLRNVRYLEPLDYFPEAGRDQRSTSGCNASTTAVNAADLTTITPNARLPWNFNNHGIPAAWTSVTGAGITVGIIDAGISSAQPLIGADFNNGDSDAGRTITTGYTYGGSAFSSCAHGTSMSGQAVGPRNATGAATGVAYRSSLRFIRACQDVVLDQSGERTGVKNALVALGDDPAVRVISMSIGTPFSSSVLTDGVNYAYGKGKMLMAAAGTSFSWTSWWGVIYPAALPKCVAVTGVKESGAKCSSCHDGSQVDLTICMERNASSSRNSLSLPPSGTSPIYIGGSSSATATAAGIAALVWSARPTATREQVLGCLTSTAQFAAAPSGSKGYGNINAAAAVNCALAP
ncbi:MAG: S8 family serine peptidase [Flavobacteriales bacterium]|nr:MAG: S8 family serine peptidase [Flavobacteriales bacterium]